MKEKKAALVFGTRPEIIKLSPIIRLLARSGQPYSLIHTGQHYSYEMDKRFFEDLKLPKPGYRLSRPSSLGANQHESLIGWMTEKIKDALKDQQDKVGVDVVLVQGDTDSVVAGVRAANDLGIPVGHVEAGLRSRDLSMPEERNRIEADQKSQFLFAPTPFAKQNLIREGFDPHRIDVTGNTIVDAAWDNLKIAQEDPEGKDPKKEGRYALVTLHRPETVDDPARLGGIIHALKILAKKESLKIIFPAHLRTRHRFDEFGMSLKELSDERLEITGPMGFLEFLRYESCAEIILTDSGGVQEEACILKVPCVTLRTTTERPETVKVGANVVVGYDGERMVAAASKMIKAKREWPNPFGEGDSAKKILKIIQES